MRILRVLAFAGLSLVLLPSVYARGSRYARPHYGGGKHTSSHGGKYINGQGQSHKGGKYRNPSGVPVYGTHK